MTVVDKHIVAAYATLLDGLNPESKLALIESLSKSLKSDKAKKDKKFFQSFGAFASDKPAEELIKEIRSARRFRDKEIQF